MTEHQILDTIGNDETIHEDSSIIEHIAELTEINSSTPDQDQEIVQNLTLKPSGKYFFSKQVGQGGMKNILKVKDRDTVRHIAMATLSISDADANVPASRFVHEARITANLEHPNIVPIHDIGVDDEGFPYFTMKLIKGETLAKILMNINRGIPEYTEKYDLPHLLSIFVKVCNAVAFAHSRNIIHLDLKPQNIQVGDFGEVLVLDWGLAKYIGENEQDDLSQTEPEISEITSSDALKTMDGEVKGTPGYMAPEQAAGDNEQKNRQTDIYALGAILYTIITGKKPIDGDDIYQIVQDTIDGKLEPPSKRAPDKLIPKPLEAVTLKAMAFEQHKRYESVDDLIRDIDKFTGGFATTAEEPGILKHLFLFLKRHKLEAFLLIFLTLSIFTASGIWITQKFKRLAAWGTAKDISPYSLENLEKDWFVAKGNWIVDSGKLQAAEGKGSSFAVFYNKPVYGDIALEFDAMVKSKEDLAVSGDLSVILAGDKDTLDGYYLQVGGLGNTSAVIQRRNGFITSVRFKLQPDKKYHIRAEKEGGVLRLFCDGMLVLQSNDIFYLEGGFVGIYTFGKGKQFWNVRLYQRDVPELVDPLIEGDAFYRESRAAKGSTRKRFLKLARKAYTKVFDSHPGRELGFKALLKRAYVNTELGDLTAARADAEILAKNYSGLDQLLLDGELSFREKNYEKAYDAYSTSVRQYPATAIGTIGLVMGELADADMERDMQMDFWQLCAENLKTPLLRCSKKNLVALDFLDGLNFDLIDCSENQINSLEPLSGMSLRSLDCAENKIKSIAPLKGMKLENLECYANPITNIEALRGMPLKSLALNDCTKLNDLSPLKECRELEKLTIPAHVKDIEFLRKLPKLKYLNTEWDGWQQTAAEFWKKYDARKKNI